MSKTDTTPWFKHDCNAKDDKKCTILIEQLGLEGYGIFWVLLECLRQEEYHRYPLHLIPSLARKYGTSSEKIKTVIHNYGLFIVEDDHFYSASFDKRMEKLHARIAQNANAGRASGQARRLLSAPKKQAPNIPQSSDEQLHSVGSTDDEHTFSPEIDSKPPNGCSTDVQRMTDGCRTNRREEKRKEKIITDKTEQEKLIATFASEFWEAYPPMRRGSISQIIYHLDAIQCDSVDERISLHQQMMNALQAYKQWEEWTKDGGKYIFGSSRFFQERRWENPPSNNGHKPKTERYCEQTFKDLS